MTGADLESLVVEYIERIRPSVQKELASFVRGHRTDEEAVERAARAQLLSKKRHPHQRRVPRAALDQSCELILGRMDDVRAARTFDELYGLINRLIRPIKGIGELTVYDTALRIGARFGREPTKVYLHAGTRVGARAIGIRSRISVEMAELPEALRRLSGHEAEDMLCRYKFRLKSAL